MDGGLIKNTDENLPAGDVAGVPFVVMAAGEKAGVRFIEFFTANIRNPNTRRAYHRACCEFFGWCESRGLQLERTRDCRCRHTAGGQFLKSGGHLAGDGAVEHPLDARRQIWRAQPTRPQRGSDGTEIRRALAPVAVPALVWASEENSASRLYRPHYERAVKEIVLLLATGFRNQ